MHLEGEAHSASRIEQATSLLVVEDPLFCKYVAALCKPSALNLGEYRLYQILDVVRGATFELGRSIVRPHKSSVKCNGLRLLQTANYLQLAQFGLQIHAIATLGIGRSHAHREHSAEVNLGGCL